MNRGWMIGAGAMLAATAGTVATNAQQPARTVQQDFEAATALDDGTDRAAALAAWEALEKRTKAGTRSNAIIQLRKGAALFRLGRNDAALAATRAGLDRLPASDDTLRADRLRAYVILGRIGAETLDYAGAAISYAQAEALADTPGEKLGTLFPLIEMQTFTDPVAAAASLARADAIADHAKLDNRVAANLARRRTTLLLNNGDFTAARVSAVKAVGLLGGITDKTDLSDVSARSDAAIAYLLTGNADEARRYMAATGAGRPTKGSFDPAAQMVAPDCGGEADLKPDQVAVVEFSIDVDGTILRAAPVYAAGGGKVALEYARAVRGWSWAPETLKDMPTFYRYNVRVEMRCSTAFTRPSIGDGLDAALDQWLTSKGAAPALVPDGPVATILPVQRAALAAAEGQGATSLATLAALYRLAGNPVVSREERAALYTRALAIAVAADAPAQAQLALDLPARTEAVADTWKRGTYIRLVSPMLAQPLYNNDPASRAAIRLMVVDNAGNDSKPSQTSSLALLHQVADDRALPANDPLRVGALVRIASIEQRAGDMAAARAAFQSSGLAASQCAIMDAPPRLLSSPDASTFPDEALRWGFEGWVQVQYDVAADGRAEKQRALLSYPPFIFSTAATKFFGDAHYAKTYRPDGGLGCGGSTTRIKFLMPK